MISSVATSCANNTNNVQSQKKSNSVKVESQSIQFKEESKPIESIKSSTSGFTPSVTLNLVAVPSIFLGFFLMVPGIKTYMYATDHSKGEKRYATYPFVAISAPFFMVGASLTIIGLLMCTDKIT